ncbi:hypothetical protein [Emticicia sp. BO119]|uniref:hypothetical protein n=1 Tax=Emticicia sp. BO119 TaxID=2757768 RepID=UPI0015F11573|nr:hypothetical protein [Emticicia sp. BO119]MBA4851341.1 hypothetical protein [Emticicia sp. BO119]
MKQETLILENGDDGLLWGRVLHEDDLIVDSAPTVEELQAKIKQLLFDFHGVEEVQFELAYDLTSFFLFFDYLKISKIAAVAGMNPSLLRHYAAGSKAASKEQVAKIENAVHELGRQMASLKLVEA